MSELKIVQKVPKLPRREANSHKGTYGKLLVLAGSLGFAGAAYLCAEAAVRAGAGLVTLGVPHSLMPLVGSRLVCPMTMALPEVDGSLSAESEEAIWDKLAQSNVLVMGPGLSQHKSTRTLTHRLLGQLEIPFVLDADGLNHLKGSPEVLEKCPAPGIVTPHPGEFGRMVGKSISEVLENPRKLAAEYAGKTGVVVVLKSQPAIATDGEHIYQNSTGNPGMATGGSGDVLTGVLGALLGQGMSPWKAARLGVFIHGMSGDLAAQNLGQIGMNAADLLSFLPMAFKNYHGF